MDNLFAQKFLIGDPFNDRQGGYDGGGINPNDLMNPDNVTPQGDSAASPIDPLKQGAIDPSKAVATPPADSDDDGSDAESDVSSAIPYLALGLIAAFLFIKFGKK
jgi:hypothetical protein